jgi:VIT1/CCC1 family predicted Fe2+/Mn2+ transporter
MKHSDIHRTHRIGWLRAAMLGANDGIVSTASLIVGVSRLLGLRTQKWKTS